MWLPSGGYLIIDSTEAMVVVDVNTGKFTGSGGNLEEAVTKNTSKRPRDRAAADIRCDVGGIIVIDFIDMVLESNRELVLRGWSMPRPRPHQHEVAAVTSSGSFR